MEWRDEGVLLAIRPHGEGSAIAEVFTAGHGRHAGVIRGGASRRMAPLLQPGAQLSVVWRARLAEHIGAFAAEPLRSRAAVLEDAARLAALASVCALLHCALPERAPHPDLWARTVAYLDGLATGTASAADYLRWEVELLAAMGFGLDLSACAVTGSRDGLDYVSPRTGRAVSRAGAGGWSDRLFPLPPVMLGRAAGPGEVAQGLAITGHFLARELAAADRPLPEARIRAVARLAR
ncbi:MAG TPA: DNA repair protein RecO [Paracoccaceae bacterium]|nr:DNA repair protein RecO [Paracoccaceae bacterium]